MSNQVPFDRSQSIKINGVTVRPGDVVSHDNLIVFVDPAARKIAYVGIHWMDADFFGEHRKDLQVENIYRGWQFDG